MQQGSTGSLAVRMVIDLINQCGARSRDTILKTGQDPAIEVFDGSGAQRIKEEASKGVRMWWWSERNTS